jgi:rRNA maturation protein Nop10
MHVRLVPEALKDAPVRFSQEDGYTRSMDCPESRIYYIKYECGEAGYKTSNARRGRKQCPTTINN